MTHYIGVVASLAIRRSPASTLLADLLLVPAREPLEEAGDQKFVFDAGPLELGDDLMEIDVGATVDVRKPATSGEPRLATALH